MAPFTSLYMSQADKENDRNLVAELVLGPSILYEYELFAVINHEGQLNNGHYTNYARYQDQWYRFDDDKVTLSSLGACLNSSAYMCFYVKRHLEYKAVTTPTYVKRREDEALKEKEQEQEKEAARIRQLEQEREKEREKEKELEADILAMI
jgi:ubiquitin carboxyl-terminal hydrolase 22/27/51